MARAWSNLNELLLTSCGSYECFEEGQRFGKEIKEESLHTLNRPAAATSCCERAHDLEGHSHTCTQAQLLTSPMLDGGRLVLNSISTGSLILQLLVHFA